jgi:hypothetical protein
MSRTQRSGPQIRDPHGGKLRSRDSSTPLAHFSPYSARQLHHQLQREHHPASLPNPALSFRKAASELCAHTALPAHSMLDWSRLLFLQRYWSRIVLYASQAQSLIRYAADLFGSVTGSSQMLGTYMTESYVVFLATTHSSHFCSWKPPVRLLHALPCHQWLEQPADQDCGCSEACHSLPRVGLRHFGRSERRGSLRWLPFPG